MKQALSSHDDIVLIAPIMYKVSTETMADPSEFSNLIPQGKVERYYLYDSHKIRIAVEQKFSTIANVDCMQRMNEGLPDHYDIFNYESSVCTLHLELEFEEASKMPDAVRRLCECLRTNSLVHELLCVAKVGNCTSNCDVTEDSEDSLRRPFVYLPPKEPVLFRSIKLDGERAKFEIINNILYISQWSLAIKLNYAFVQCVVGHVERLALASGYEYIIIDIFNFSSVRDFHVVRASHIEAIAILNEIGKMNLRADGYKLHIQKFFQGEPTAPESWPTDGQLHFYEKSIVKVKKNAQFGSFVTVDLMLKKSIYLPKLIEHLSELYAQKQFTFLDANGYETSLTHNNCKPGKQNIDVDLIVNEPIRRTLQFSCGTHLDEGWAVDMRGCENLWGSSNTVINVAIVELLIDLPQKTLIFQRIRSDKFVANSIQVFREMLKC